MSGIPGAASSARAADSPAASVGPTPAEESNDGSGSTEDAVAVIEGPSGDGSASMDWIGLDLFNDDTRPTEHISHPTQVGSLTVYNLWQFISDRRMWLLVKIPLCKSRESSQRGSSKSQQCSLHPKFPAELHIPKAQVNGLHLSTMMASSGRSSGQDMGLRGLGMTNSKLGDDNLLSFG